MQYEHVPKIIMLIAFDYNSGNDKPSENWHQINPKSPPPTSTPPPPPNPLTPHHGPDYFSHKGVGGSDKAGILPFTTAATSVKNKQHILEE